MHKTIKILFVSSIFITLFGFFNFSHAQVTQTNHIAGRFERLRERVSLILSFSQDSKVDKHKELLNKRLNELVYVSENKLLNDYETVSYRYAAYAGRLTDFILEKKITHELDSTLPLFDEHQKVLSDLLAKEEHDSAYWLLIKQDLDSLDSLTNRLKSSLQ